MIDDLVRIKDTCRVHPISSMVAAHLETNELDEIGPSGFGVSKEYEMSLKVETKFICNSAQKRHGEITAYKYLKRKIYGDVIDDLREAVLSCTELEIRETLCRCLSKMED